MSPRHQSQLNLAASSTALGAGVAPAGAARPLMIDADMGDSASQTAIERLDRAVSDLRAIKVRPLLRRAVAAIRAEDHDSAADLALKVLSQDEHNGLAWHVLAIAREKQGDLKAAIQCFESALTLLVDHAEVAHDLGRIAYAQGLKPLALKLFQHYHEARPDCAQGVNNLACVMRDMNDFDGAIHVLKPALMADPSNIMLWNTLGTVLGEKGETEQSLPFFDEALRLDPGFSRARYNLGNALMDLGRPEAALEHCETALRLGSSPADLTMMRLSRAFGLLCVGRVSEGWEAYETRLDPMFPGYFEFPTDRPLWSAQCDLTGSALLVVGEQGLGDEMMFANLIPDMLKAIGPEGHLTIAVESRLVTLFQRSFPGATVLAHITTKFNGRVLRAIPDLDHDSIDLWTPMGSPLQRFRPSAEAFPRKPGFLKADPARVEYWRGLLRDHPGPKVGLLWKSLKLDGGRLKHYTPFDQWRAVLETPGATFVNLQYGDCQAELAQARAELGLEIWRPPGIDLKQDLDDVAALCCAMDVVIGPPNATSSLAGACGAPLWMISTPAAWPRLGTLAYPWYPQARVFFPETLNRWDDTMRAIADALAEVVRAYPSEQD